jgi:23S rRNA (guanine745-N1)-methyltransferase
MNTPPPSAPSLTCPVCKGPLHLKGRTYTCAANHSFDLAKEGYANLLLSHQRRSKTPGDDKAMIQARRRFFDSGAFDPVTEQISKLIPEGTVLDCGCGEGHFLGALNGECIGIDVSKDAIRCAAKQYRDTTWIVANGMRELPIADQSIDSILSVLAPRNTEEFARILKPAGQLILGVPGPNHLIELRTQLNANAGDFEEKADVAAKKCLPLFSESTRENVSYQTTLKKEQISDLIQMTPIFWNSSPEAKEEIQQLETLKITISFTLLILRNAP